MMPKILTVLLIVMTMTPFCKTDVVRAPVATAPVVAAAPAWGGWPVDWNHDGIIDWRDGWNGWNNGWRGDWNPAWGWNGAWDRNGDGIIDWRDGAWGGRRGNWGAPVVTEPVVSRRLGGRDVASTLRKSDVRPVALKNYGDHVISYIKKKGDEDIGLMEPPSDYGYPGQDGGNPEDGMMYDENGKPIGYADMGQPMDSYNSTQPMNDYGGMEQPPMDGYMEQPPMDNYGMEQPPMDGYEEVPEQDYQK